MKYSISQKEREYLRDLAKRQKEISQLPIMEERTKRWYAHNDNKKGQPMIIVEADTFQNEILPPLKCESPFARSIEFDIAKNIVVHELLDDDQVCPDSLRFSWDVTYKELGIDIGVKKSKDSKGREIGYIYEHPIVDLDADFHKLKQSTFTVDRQNSKDRIDSAKDILGDILKVEIDTGFHRWGNMITMKIIQLMGMEAWMVEMIDNPKGVHRITKLVTDNLLAYQRWLEAEGLLTMNNKNHYTGAGSRGFTNQVQAPEDGKVLMKHMWVNVNSQESTGISADMYKEFVYPYIDMIAREYGFVYYGCCEAVDPLWDICLKDLSNMKKVSISAWCNEEFMGERLANGPIIYSRKPSPHYLGVGYDFDQKEYENHILRTLRAAKDCNLEIIFRDVYTLSGNLEKPKRAVHILRDLIEKHW